MSKLRISAELILPDDASGEAQQVYDDLLALASRLETLTPAVGRPERSRVRLHRCHHDEPGEAGPCEVLDQWESA